MKKEKDIICSKCNSKIPSDSKFCFVCGEKVDKQEEVVVETVPHRGRPKKIVDVDSVSKNDEIIKKEEVKEEIKEQPKVDNNVPPVNNIGSTNKSSFESKKKYIYPVIAVVVTFVLCFGAFTCFYEYYLKHLVIETTKREVTVTDTGISEAVEKVYDSVVVVESYVKNQLYATGTGFVYKVDGDKGFILTNNHVIENADEIKVVFTNNEREKVDLVGNDSYSDVALLAVDKEEVISVAEIGSSEDLKIGDTAFAVGAPLDSSIYAWTTTRGIISGKNRNVEVTTATNGFYSNSYVMEVLQTDAAINNGNSGGPLCNSNGQVIGITNMKLASDKIEGMGFAIPIETATKIAERFIKGESISYPYIGVTVADAKATYMNPTASGVYVQEVEKGSPADKGGLKKGDKILKVNDVEVENSSFFKFQLYKHDVGEKVRITVLRDGNEKVLDVTLGSKGMNT